MWDVSWIYLFTFVQHFIDFLGTLGLYSCNQIWKHFSCCFSIILLLSFQVNQYLIYLSPVFCYDYFASKYILSLRCSYYVFSIKSVLVFKNLAQDQRDYRVNSIFILHVFDPGLIHGIPYSLLSIARIIMECRARRNPRSTLGVT